jgi:uncharacterized protein YqgC (DUF456 family)
VDFAQLAGLTITLVAMLAGLVGCVVPGIPGTPLILAAALVHRLVFGEASIGYWALSFMALLTLLSLALDYLATLYGARRLGATWRGLTGAMLGMVIGLFFGPIGIVLAPFLGATAFEYLGGRELKAASKAGLGTLLGILAGAVGKAACALAMIGFFTLNVLSRS